MQKYKLAIVASHPIQYQAPLFRALARDPRLEVTVYYCWDFGVSEPGLDRELGIKVKWDIPLLEGYRYVFLKNRSLRPGTSFFGQVNPSIIGELKRNKFDAVLVHGYTAATSWLIFLTRWYTGAKVILRGEADLGKQSGSLKKKIKFLVLGTLFKTIPAFLYSYTLNREFFVHYGAPEEKLFFFPCSVDNDFFSKRYEELREKRDELKRSVGIEDVRIPTFLFVGKLMKRKRTFDILKACELLRGKATFNLLFVGEGEDRKELEAYARERSIKNVRFFGFRNQSEIPVFYTVSDVLLLPSEFDPSPKQVNEAMNFGIASIVSDGVGTAPDLIADGNCGFIHKVGDIPTLAGYMEKLALDRALLKKFKENSLRTVAKWSYRENAEGISKAIQTLVQKIAKHMDSFTLHKNAQMGFRTVGKHHFFGYYDKCPWSADGRFLLALEADFIDHLPLPTDAASIGVIDLKGGGTFKKIVEIRAWNWQQGCMLQWLGPDYKSRVIFNDFRGGKFVSVILNIIDGKEERVIPFPVYTVHPSGRCALSLNFSRLDEVREGYGYKGIHDASVAEEKPRNDGIYFVDLEKGTVRLMILLAQISEFQSMRSMGEGKHWVDHLTFNPSGTRFAFLHRWQTKDGGLYSRLYTADSDVGALVLLLDTGMVSHFGWKNDMELLAWGRPPSISSVIVKSSFLRGLLVPIYHSVFPSPGHLKQKISGDSFLLFHDQSHAFEKVGEGILTEDGHCSFSPDKKWLLTDTYPGKEHYRHLMLFNLSSGELIEVGKFYSLPDGAKEDWDLSALRADLHPRWNRAGDKVCFDSVHEGSRQMYVVDIGMITGAA
ncbi:MAG: glycosyltransferase family 4 protein [Candidatus Jorgensenbacteria bacterium]